MALSTSAEGVSADRRARSVGVGRAHAKAVLLGEHAVVYGAPALAVPVPQLTVTASVHSPRHGGDGPGEVSFTMTGSPSRPMVAQATDGLRRLIGEFTATMGLADSPRLEVTIDGGIPHGRGLGSSAACARAVVHALAELYDREVTERETFDLVQTAENLAHGRSSGVDARAVGALAPLLFQRGEVQELSIGCYDVLVLADSGVVGRTKDAVELLREGFQRHTGAQERFVDRAAGLTEQARLALADGRPEDLGARLTDYHDLLRAAGLSTNAIDTLVEAALTAGSLGAKITGGGLGGCVLALTRREQAAEVTRELHAAGAVRCWTVPLKGPDEHAC
ncbi:mevalonate kinase [Streptomyces davaonensis JCM 4913]|uniref:mevalonate kinase n=1 Tax=Streptomyces davaonensis (strain DSM 101723 / JCM 4913 / KCC S-0913 / 768) TaxID=1214101 RepID=K4RGL4_STRDJ|nr:mevalonate kinase [Streptomyces davaonensis]CCK32329.1 mevalonate kinase [Streptomyces davaonensis JCM 4913]